MEFARISIKDLEAMPIDKLYSWVLEFSGVKTARQLVYNRKKQYIGCEFDTSIAPPVSNLNGYYCLCMKRLSYGCTADGEWEPGTPDKWKRDHARESVER